MADEFDIIRRLFAPLSKDAPGAFGLTDDAAVFAHPVGFEHVVTTDTVVEGVHYPRAASPKQAADKLVGSNLSDLAAMGAVPVGFTLSCAWPSGTPDAWIEDFAAALAPWCKNFQFPLLGGDTVSVPQGPQVFTLTALGRVPAGQALRRNGAHPGDTVFATGTVGDGALGLMAFDGRLPSLADGPRHFLIGRYACPAPRVAAGQGLVGLATACIDISDGLVQDAGHIAAASGVDLIIDAPALPLSAAAADVLAADPARLSDILGGGDDYELLFTAPTLPSGLGVPVTAIGRVEAGAGIVRVLDAGGAAISIERPGYRHL